MGRIRQTLVARCRFKTLGGPLLLVGRLMIYLNRRLK